MALERAREGEDAGPAELVAADQRLHEHYGDEPWELRRAAWAFEESASAFVERFIEGLPEPRREEAAEDLSDDPEDVASWLYDLLSDGYSPLSEVLTTAEFATFQKIARANQDLGRQYGLLQEAFDTAVSTAAWGRIVPIEREDGSTYWLLNADALDLDALWPRVGAARAGRAPAQFLYAWAVAPNVDLVVVASDLEDAHSRVDDWFEEHEESHSDLLGHVGLDLEAEDYESLRSANRMGRIVLPWDLFSELVGAALIQQLFVTGKASGHVAWVYDVDARVPAPDKVGLRHHATLAQTYRGVPGGRHFVYHLFFTDEELEPFLVWQDALLQSGHPGFSRILPDHREDWPGGIRVRPTGPHHAILA